MPNMLKNSKSPYLREHSEDPVEWVEWSEGVTEAAKNSGKLVFLSIGYSACHWCHVMQSESFKDAEIAGILNSKYVAVKVDKEERPDIDSFYMSLCISRNGGGGWPLTVIMTPSLEVLFIGTYLPKNDRNGMRGLKSVLETVYSAWKRDGASKVISHGNDGKQKDASVGDGIFEDAFRGILWGFDRRHGGFGSGPKFPMPTYLSYLLMYWRKYENPYALAAVELTLTKLREGGVYDQVGMGVHRYSADGYWMVPHFEKMLYDQALLCNAYAEACKATRQGYYGQIAREIADFAISSLATGSGAFMTSIDADSEDGEGAYYLFSYGELSKALDDDEMKFAVRHFGIEKGGNFGDEKGRNIFYIKESLEQMVASGGNLEELENLEKSVRIKALKIRNARIHPKMDDKVLADQNGMMISALCNVYRVSGERGYLDAAKLAALQFMNGKLMHSYLDGIGYVEAFVDDYAFVASAMLDLYQLSGERAYLQRADALCSDMVSLFYKEGEGFSRSASRMWKSASDSRDSVVQSGISAAACALFTASRLLGKPHYEEIASKSIQALSNDISDAPVEHSSMLVTLMKMRMGFCEIVVSQGSDGKADVFMKKLMGSFIPDACIAHYQESDAVSPTEGMVPVGGKSSIYVCTESYCMKPVFDPEEALTLVNKSRAQDL